MAETEIFRKSLSDDAVRDLAQSASGSELAFKLSVACPDKGDLTYGDLDAMFCEMSSFPRLAKALAELLSSSQLFDAAISKSHYSTDYWLAGAMGGECRKTDYVRYYALEHFADGGPEWGWRNSNRYTAEQKAGYDAGLAELYSVLVAKLTPLDGEVPASVVNFKMLHGI